MTPVQKCTNSSYEGITINFRCNPWWSSVLSPVSQRSNLFPKRIQVALQNPGCPKTGQRPCYARSAVCRPLDVVIVPPHTRPRRPLYYTSASAIPSSCLDETSPRNTPSAACAFLGWGVCERESGTRTRTRSCKVQCNGARQHHHARERGSRNPRTVLRHDYSCHSRYCSSRCYSCAKRLN